MDRLPPPVLFELSVAAQKVGQVLALSLAGTPVRLEDAALLNQLGRLEPMTPTALASRLGVSPSTLTYRLKGLEARGWVSRRANPADGRSALLGLTPERAEDLVGGAARVRRSPAFRRGAVGAAGRGRRLGAGRRRGGRARSASGRCRDRWLVLERWSGTTASRSRASSGSSRRARVRWTGSTCASSPARSTASWGRTAPASRRRC